MTNAYASYWYLEKYLDKDIFEVMTDTLTGNKLIEFHGYITERYHNDDYPYEIAQYSGNIVSMSKWKKKKFDGDQSNDFFNHSRKMYFEPCTERQAIELINHWEYGKPLLEGSLVNADKLADGTYINIKGE